MALGFNELLIFIRIYFLIIAPNIFKRIYVTHIYIMNANNKMCTCTSKRTDNKRWGNRWNPCALIVGNVNISGHYGKYYEDSSKKLKIELS